MPRKKKVAEEVKKEIEEIAENVIETSKDEIKELEGKEKKKKKEEEEYPSIDIGFDIFSQH